MPDGYQYIDFDAKDIAVCFVKGKEPEIYFTCCMSKLAENGFEWKANADGVKYCFERYSPVRFTTPDKDGDIILDQCYYL